LPGASAPIAFTCAPGRNQPASTTGARDGVEVHTTSQADASRSVATRPPLSAAKALGRRRRGVGHDQLELGVEGEVASRR
jgi:hypothetical protein